MNELCVHSLRATAATNALSHEADIAKVQEWLGHANVSTIRPYDRRKRGRKTVRLFALGIKADLTYFIIHQLSVVMRALDSLHEYIARKTREIRNLEKELQGIEVLNHRQRALIRHAVRHPGKRYTVAEHQRSQNVSYESARSDLLDLVDRHLLESAMVGNKWVFTAQSHLGGRLAALGINRSAILA